MLFPIGGPFYCLCECFHVYCPVSTVHCLFNVLIRFNSVAHTVTCWRNKGLYMTTHVSCTVMKIWSLKYLGSVITICLSCTVTGIWRHKDFGVMISTVWGHVTSSVTWLVDSPHMVSYKWSLYLAWQTIYKCLYRNLSVLSLYQHATMSLPHHCIVIDNDKPSVAVDCWLLVHVMQNAEQLCTMTWAHTN